MSDEVVDPLLLGQRVVAILETGLRTATYKLATLMALVEHCIENLPDHAGDALVVPLPELARRVLGIYWQQVRPFDGRELRQSTQPRARILIAANDLRAAAGRFTWSVDVAAMRAPTAYEHAINEITLCLAQQPLHRLQKLPGSSASDPFLYDDSFLHDQVSRGVDYQASSLLPKLGGVLITLARHTDNLPAGPAVPAVRGPSPGSTLVTPTDFFKFPGTISPWFALHGSFDPTTVARDAKPTDCAVPNR